MTLKVWLHGLAAAAIGAASSSITALIVDPTKFNFTGDGFLALAKVAVVSAIVAVAGYLAKSPLPESETDTSSSSGGPKIVALALCALLLMGSMTGCTSQDVATTVKNIAVYAQEAQPIITQVITLVTLFGATDATQANEMQKAGTTIKTDLATLVDLCNQYNAHPADSTWKQIIALVDTLVNESDTALLRFAGIKSADSQKEALIALSTIDALLHTIDGLIQANETPNEVKAKAFSRSVKMQTISRYWSPSDKQQIALAFGTNYDRLLQHELAMGY